MLDVYAPPHGGRVLALTLSMYLAGNIERQVDVSSLGQSVISRRTWGFFLFTGLLGLIFTKSFAWPGWDVLLSPVYNYVLAPVLFGSGTSRWSH